jgi:thiamine-monophosphate kinase
VELKKLGEFGLIEKIARSACAGFPTVIKGIGDDAAVVRSSKKKCQLLTTDTLIEGIHFEPSLTTPYLLGKKCIAVNLSDIAAMGGTPVCFVVSLSTPPKTPYEFIHKLYQGMIQRARAFGVSLVGGDTTGSRDHMVITVTVLGTARTDQVIYRHGARAGDAIYVTGFLGDAALGLLLLQRRKALSRIRFLVKKHLDPMPRVAEGKTISRMRLASSMIDISDGLLADLRHILKESQAGARIWLNHLPLSPPYRKHWQEGADDRYAPALCGGEDYELLFTVPPDKQKRVAALERACGIPVTCIGEITGKKGALKVLDEQNREVAYGKEGFTHF